LEKTTIVEKFEVKLKNPILIEGFPGLGMVGRIATSYLAKKLKAQKFAVLYSPHFPYYVIVNGKGSVRLLRGVFSFWKNESGGNDLIFLTGDSQAQTIEGQYEIANCILDFAKKHDVKLVITVGGYRKETEETPKVVAAATDRKILEKAVKADAIVSPAGNPIVGTAGLLIGLARFRKMDALCLLSETRGYLPDPKAAKSILHVIQRLLNLKVDMGDLEKEIEKSEKIIEKMRQIEQRRELQAQRMRKTEEGRITYIS